MSIQRSTPVPVGAPPTPPATPVSVGAPPTPPATPVPVSGGVLGLTAPAVRGGSACFNTCGIMDIRVAPMPTPPAVPVPAGAGGVTANGPSPGCCLSTCGIMDIRVAPMLGRLLQGTEGFLRERVLTARVQAAQVRRRGRRSGQPPHRLVLQEVPVALLRVRLCDLLLLQGLLLVQRLRPLEAPQSCGAELEDVP